MKFNFDERPFIVIWEVTRACALACRHCRASAQTQRHPLELNHAESLALIEQVARAHPMLFVLTGGDPVRRPDLLSLIRHASARGLRVGLTPSATPDLLAQDFNAFREAGVARLALSLDGASRESHDRFRGVPGTWDLTVAALAKAREAGLELQINTTFTRQNLGEFDDFVNLMLEIRPALWSVFQLVPTGRGRLDDLLTADEMENLFLKLWRLSLAAPFDIKTTEGNHYRRVVLQQMRTRNADTGESDRPPAQGHPMTRGQLNASLAAPAALAERAPGPQPVNRRAPPGIGDGKGFVFISHIGEIFPSGFLPLPAGNVRKDELIGVYREHPMFRQLRDASLLGGKCGRCEFRSICGGSRSRAFAVHGDYLAEEPLCAYEPPLRAARQQTVNVSQAAASAAFSAS